MSATGVKWTAAVVAIAALFAVPPLYGHFLAQQLSDYLIFGLPALAVGLIAGHARLLNIGVGATFGVSAYAVAIMSQHGVLNPVLLMVGAIGAGVLVSVLFAIYAVVSTGLEYLLLTLLTTSAFAGLPLIFANLTGGENGLPVPPQGAVVVSFGLDPLVGTGFYWLLCGVTVFWCVLTWYLLSSRAGRVMVGIGRNPVRAAAMGYSVHGYQVAVTLYSGAMAACGGWLYAIAHAGAFLDLLGLNNSVNAVLYSLIGGVDSVVGPLLGTAALRRLSEFLATLGTTQSQLYIGLALLVVVYLMPSGVAGLGRQLWQLRSRVRGDEPTEAALARDIVLSGVDE